MNDDTSNTDDRSAGDASAPPPAEDRVGFCQDCGKPLTPATIRPVGAGVFCEPCLANRVGATAPAAGYTTVPPYTAPITANEPSPVLAAILGFIPGVGAMYNGQFAKGIVHLAVFAVLVSLSDNVNGIFGVFVAGWVFYMAFEAYHTAVARRDGLPLPNAFNLNDIGERMGFGKSSPATGTTRPPTPTGTVPTAGAAGSNPYTAPASAPVNPVPVGTAPDWVGYVPPTAFASSTYRPEAANPQQYVPATPYTPYTQIPYSEAYTGASTAPAAAAESVAFVTPSRRFPTGAIWLIALGALILIANLLPDWKLTEHWWPPLLFAGLAVWTFTRRFHPGVNVLCIIRWPLILMILAVMLALHAAGVLVTFGLICSVLLIAFGALLLLERVAAQPPVYMPSPATGTYEAATTPLNPEADEARSRAAWESGAATPSNDPGEKGGQ